MVWNTLPRCFAIVSSAVLSRVGTIAGLAENATFPLDKRVFTSLNPAASKQRLRSGILQFIGLTPLRKAT
jgi:phage tail sheath protein FI